MAKVNLPPIKIPASLLQIAEQRSYFEALNFSVYQLYQRTGGGTDGLDEIRAELELIIIDITDLEFRVDALEAEVAAIKIRLDSIELSIAIIIARLDALEDTVALLQSTFSWKTIPTDEEVTIGTNQQMIVADGINIEGSLVIDGELSLI